MATAQAAATASEFDARQLVLDRYKQRIDYYWAASTNNKRSYKTTRYLTVILGALVTLISSMSSADFVKGVKWIAVSFAILTPVFAALMAIVAGLSQGFQWGAAWSDMVITATRLEKERDRISVTPPGEIDPVKEMALLDDAVLTETQTFFQRIFGSGGPAKPA
jgi:hypothetical protein